MPNAKGWRTRNEMMDTGAACFIPDAPGALTGRWQGSPPEDGIMLTRGRCAELGAPVKDREYPVVFIYRVQTKDDYRYVPFYHRQAHEIDRKKTNYLEERVLQRRANEEVDKRDPSDILEA
ncbi:hypothetical protein [Paenibacillus sp. B2(2019)]|uniref:hypothetical protein n=1 Tax=Paenibacillus sp. B2(2019) TaxID=2607754 RepID=UPI0011F32D3B|nr:hypothetical protein [Paenibacillus sp. B2(2019)]KAA1180670.1 hypothetical protein PAENI_25800 [Paenibacillus sp. B2(2019)]